MLDLDVVVEGDARPVARCVARSVEGTTLVEHERFITATVELGSGGHLDFVSARRERYPAPGALPDVTRGSLDDDLKRRDFTINAMALRLDGPRAGELVDPCGGLADLEAGVVRALHERSFVDDPSRVVRAARYAGRLDFAVSERTAAAARAAAPMLDWTVGRNAGELLRLCCEDDPVACAARLAAWGAPGIVVADRAVVERIERVLAAPGAPAVLVPGVVLGLLMEPSELAQIDLPAAAVGVAGGAAEGMELAARLARPATPGEIDRALRGARVGAQVVAAAAGGAAVPRWWAEHRDLRLAIDGNDLQAAGIAAGPAIGRALDAARCAMIDGDAPDRARQLEAALRSTR